MAVRKLKGHVPCLESAVPKAEDSGEVANTRFKLESVVCGSELEMESAGISIFRPVASVEMGCRRDGRQG